MIQAAFQALGHSAVGLWMRDSTWGFALVETVHLLALAVLGGAVLIVDLTAAKLLFRRTNDGGVIAQATAPALILSLAAMLGSGVLLVSSKPVRYYLDDTFRLKMVLLAAAMVMSAFVHRLLVQPPRDAAIIPIVAWASLALWLGVGVCGRLIGFL